MNGFGATTAEERCGRDGDVGECCRLRNDDGAGIELGFVFDVAASRCCPENYCKAQRGPNEQGQRREQAATCCAICCLGICCCHPLFPQWSSRWKATSPKTILRFGLPGNGKNLEDADVSYIPLRSGFAAR